jgi:hypothetical protein
VPGGQLDQLGGTCADLPLGRGRQVLRSDEWLADAASLPATVGGRGYHVLQAGVVAAGPGRTHRDGQKL